MSTRKFNFFNKSGGEKSPTNIDLDESQSSNSSSISNDNLDTPTIDIPETESGTSGANKRNCSVSPPSVTNSKQQKVSTPMQLNLDDSLSQALGFKSSDDDPLWVSMLFQFLDVMRSEILSVDRRVEKIENFTTDVLKRMESLENDSNEMKQKIECLDNDSDSLKKITVSLEKSSDRTSEKIVSIDNDIVVLKQNTNELEKGISFTNNMCDELKKQISSITLANKNLTKTVDGLLNQVDMNEQHSRSECLLLHGVPEGKSETPKQSIDLFTKNISQHIGYDIHPDSIRRAHRLGKRTTSGKPRPIIARFWSSMLRNDLYFNKKLCKEKPISITENLTKRRVLLKSDAEKKYGTKNVWTKEGRIYAKEEASGNIKLILA